MRLRFTYIIIVFIPFGLFGQGGVDMPDLPSDLPAVDVVDADLGPGIDGFDVAKNLGKKALDLFTGGIGGDILGGGSDAAMLEVLREIRRESADLKRIMQESNLKKGIKALQAANEFSDVLIDVHHVSTRTMETAERLNSLAHNPRINSGYVEDIEDDLRRMKRHITTLKKMGKLYLGVGQEMNSGQRAEGLKGIQETLDAMDGELDDISSRIGKGEEALVSSLYFSAMVLENTEDNSGEFYKNAAEKIRSMTVFRTSGIFYGGEYQEAIDMFMDIGGMIVFVISLYLTVSAMQDATPLIEYRYLAYIIVGYVFFRSILF